MNYKIIIYPAILFFILALNLFGVPKEVVAASYQCDGYLNCCYGWNTCCWGWLVYPYCGDGGYCVDYGPLQCYSACGGCAYQEVLVRDGCAGDGGYICRGAYFNEPDEGPGCYETQNCCEFCSTPTPEPTCLYGSWVDEGCGENGCPEDQMYQTRWTNPLNCTDPDQCVNDPDCACDNVIADIRANGSNGPITVNAGSTVTISWTSTYADSCNVTYNGNSVGSGTSGSLSYTIGASSTASRTYNLSCSNDCDSSTDSVTVNGKNWCTVYATPDPKSAPGRFDISLRGGAIGDHAGVNNVRAWVERQDTTRAEGGETYIGGGADEYINNLNMYFYELKDIACSSSNGAECSDTAYNVSIPNNDYYFHCDAYTDPVKCSGNPFCIYEDGPDLVDCAANGWQSCSLNDNDAENFYLPCPTNLDELCGVGGTSVQFNWTPFNSAFASYYRTRRMPLNGSWTNWVNTTTPPTVSFSITSDTSYSWQVQGVRPDRTPAADDICDAGSFSCGGASCKALITPNGTPPGTPYGVSLGQDQMFTTSVYDIENGTVSQVTFNSSNASVLDPDSHSDTASPYSGIFEATGSVGVSTTLTTRVYMSGIERCSDYTLVRVLASPAWWRVRDADVFANGGSLNSLLYSGDFDLDGSGGFPGIPIYGTTTNLTNDNVSSRGWMVQAGYSGEINNYDYFLSKIPSTIEPYIITNSSLTGAQFIAAIDACTLANNCQDSKGYKWLRATSTSGFTISDAANLGNRKAILFVTDVDSPFTTNGNLGVNDGTGFLMVIANDTIRVGANVTNLEGIYVADSGEYFRTLSDGSDTTLTLRGMAVSWGGFDLNRTYPPNTSPAELFTFAPDQLFLIPSEFGKRNIIWKEVAP
jgi:hypothetical protein